MPRRLVTGLFALGVIILVVGLVARHLGVEQFDRRMNRLTEDPLAPVPTPEDELFHESLFIADLHADTLKWDRDLLDHSGWGHADLPRLVEGNVALQVFSVVTKSPIPQVREGYPRELCANIGGIDVTALLSAVQGRPVFNPRARALHQVSRLKDAAERSRTRSGPELRIITDIADLRRLIQDRRAGRSVIGAVLGIEGGHWVGASNLGAETVEADMRQLFDMGVRMFAPTHRFDNSLSGASEGCERYGLTPAGRKALREAERLGIAVDLAHISPQGLRDALSVLEKPFVVSHTGIQAGCEPPCRPARNLSDEDIALILQNHGVIGVGYWPEAIGPSVWRIAAVMRHILDIGRARGLRPEDNIALGSDYDGSVAPFFDASQLAILTTILRQFPEAFDERTIRNIAGLNACRLFARVLPGGSPEAADEICAAAEVPSLPVRRSVGATAGLPDT